MCVINYISDKIDIDSSYCRLFGSGKTDGGNLDEAKGNPDSCRGWFVSC